MTDNRTYEIVNKETGKVIGTYPTFEEAYNAYEKLGWEMTDYAIGLKNEVTA